MKAERRAGYSASAFNHEEKEHCFVHQAGSGVEGVLFIGSIPPGGHECFDCFGWNDGINFACAGFEVSPV